MQDLATGRLLLSLEKIVHELHRFNLRAEDEHQAWLAGFRLLLSGPVEVN